jgi:nicotinamide mononucleotide transporter
VTRGSTGTTVWGRDNVILASLSLASTAAAVTMAWQGLSSWLEAASFVTGAICVWLTVKESAWNFPIGLVNSATYSVVFLRAGLYGDGGLQIVYLILGALGWYWWLNGGTNRSELVISRTPRSELLALAVIASAATLVLWQTLGYLGGSSSFWDALTTAISLAAQWLLNKKRLENWVGWIIVDLIYIPLYAYKGLYLTSLLYAVFLAMAVIGLQEWRRSLVQRTGEVRPTAPAV